MRALSENLITPKPGLDPAAEDTRAYDADIEFASIATPGKVATFRHDAHAVARVQELPPGGVQEEIGQSAVHARGHGGGQVLWCLPLQRRGRPIGLYRLSPEEKSLVTTDSSWQGARRTVSLRTKGILALCVLAGYVAMAASLLAHERRGLEVVGQQLESHRSLRALLAPTFNTLAHTLVQTQAILSSPQYSEGVDVRYSQIAASLDPLMNRLHKLGQMDPGVARRVATLDNAVEAVRSVPSGRNLAKVRNAEQELIAQLDDILSSLGRQSERLAERYHHEQKVMNAVAVGTSILGALASAAVILIFFTRLARDIERLRERAFSIVFGYSGAPLVHRRRDEVGGLIDAINHMQTDLRRWEQQQEISRQQRFHQEKMAAVGSMAAAIGHEVSNPIAAIAGVAQFLIDETRSDTHRTSRLAHEFGIQILNQTERISLIMRQLANLTRPHSPDPELLDLNTLVKSTCSFIRYDKRFHDIAFDYELDHELPAATAVADHVTQVLMNLLINAADAMERVSENARIRVTTSTVGDQIKLTVADTGHGMTAEVRNRAFEESFTTKPAGRGGGIGLFLCKTLVEQDGGRIELASIVNVGTTVSVFMPLRATAETAGP